MLPTGLLKEHAKAILMATRFIDMLVISFASELAYIVRFGEVIFPINYSIAILLAILLVPIIFSWCGIYRTHRGQRFFVQIMNLTKATIFLALTLSCLAFLTKSGDAYSRLWFLIWMLFTFSGLMLARSVMFLLLRYMRTHGMNERRIIIFGAGALGGKLSVSLQQALWTGFRIVAFLDDNITNKPSTLHNIPVLLTPDNLSEYLQREQIDEIWLALPLRAEPRVKEILYALRYATITTRFVLDIYDLDLLNHSITEVAGFPVLNIRSTPMQGINRMVKAIEDRILAACILIFISPLLTVIALCVKLSSKGPVLFKQARLGWDGKIINVYKFRTMHLHTESDGSFTQASIDDKRITAFGKWLRRTSLDELPQFFNVLQGRMSIVGPRPHALLHNEMYKDSICTYMQRHRVKPGITGWAQINGWRGETNTLEKMQKRVDFDLYYIEHWSLWFDVKIILLTVIRGFIHRNAY